MWKLWGQSPFSSRGSRESVVNGVIFPKRTNRLPQDGKLNAAPCLLSHKGKKFKKKTKKIRLIQPQFGKDLLIAVMGVMTLKMSSALCYSNKMPIFWMNIIPWVYLSSQADVPMSKLLHVLCWIWGEMFCSWCHCSHQGSSTTLQTKRKMNKVIAFHKFIIFMTV